MPAIKTSREFSYEVSPRVVLAPGDKFRVSGGPYWKSLDGERHSLAVRGVCTFLAAVVRGKRVYIEAIGGGGVTVILHVAGSRPKVSEGVVTRPYKIKGRVGVRGKATKRKKARR